MKGQMDGCCNGEWGGERGRLAGMGFASKCMRHWSYSRMHKCSLFHSYTRTHILIGFDCFLDNGIVFSRIRGGSYALVFQHSCSKLVHQLIYFTGNSLFRCPSKGHCSVPPLQEVVTFHVLFFFLFFFSTIPYKVEEGVGRKVPESKTQESLRRPWWQRRRF